MVLHDDDVEMFATWAPEAEPGWTRTRQIKRAPSIFRWHRLPIAIHRHLGMQARERRIFFLVARTCIVVDASNEGRDCACRDN